MDDAILYLLPLAGGYALSTTWTASLYHASRESGHRLYLRAIFYAAILLIICTLLHTSIFSNSEFYRNNLLGFVSEIFELETETSLFGDSSVYLIICSSVLIGPFLGHLLNTPKLLLYLNIPRQGFLAKTLQRIQYWEVFLLKHAIKNNDFEKLIARSVFSNLPIMFTLENGKVYVGWAVAAPNPSHTRRAVRILPLLSGYRNSATHKVVFVTDYYEVFDKMTSDVSNELDHLTAEDFEVVLPVDYIISAHLFDLVVYDHFKENKQRQTAE
ncbi:MAG: hypothetical protein AB2594_19080 [Candidatus Thiodiazotropha sp.]